MLSGQSVARSPMAVIILQRGKTSFLECFRSVIRPMFLQESELQKLCISSSFTCLRTSVDRSILTPVIIITAGAFDTPGNVRFPRRVVPS